MSAHGGMPHLAQVVKFISKYISPKMDDEEEGYLARKRKQHRIVQSRIHMRGILLGIRIPVQSLLYCKNKNGKRDKKRKTTTFSGFISYSSFHSYSNHTNREQHENICRNGRHSKNMLLWERSIVSLWFRHEVNKLADNALPIFSQFTMRLDNI